MASVSIGINWLYSNKCLHVCQPFECESVHNLREPPGCPPSMSFLFRASSGAPHLPDIFSLKGVWYTILMIIICWIRAHRTRHVRQLSEVADLVRCKRCRRMWALNHNVRVALDWSYEVEQHYEHGTPLPINQR